MALGAGIEAGAALLLYTGNGFLGTAGFLIALSIAGVGFGVWVGSEPATVLRRWLSVVFAFAAAGVFAALWSSHDELRATGWGGALAALFLLAEPAYTAGGLLSALGARRAVAVPAMLGAALGVLVAALILIPSLPASVIFTAAAILLAIIALWDARRAPQSGMNRSTAMMSKVVLLTGVGHRGQVGFAIAQRVLAAGGRVCVTDVTPSVTKLAGVLGTPAEVLGVQADLTDAHAVQQLIARIETQFGRLDAVINVAGGLSVIKAIAETTLEEWRRELQRNADTAYAVTRSALPMLRAARGAIVNFAAPAAMRAQPQLGAYSAAKAAVVALTRAVAIEEKSHGIRANAVAPGMIDTEQNRNSVADPDQVKWVTRDQIADVVLFLISDAGSAVTGETIHVLGEGIE